MRILKPLIPGLLAVVVLALIAGALLFWRGFGATKPTWAWHRSDSDVWATDQVPPAGRLARMWMQGAPLHQLALSGCTCGHWCSLLKTTRLREVVELEPRASQGR